MVLDYYFPIHKFQVDRILKQILISPKLYPPVYHLSIVLLFLIIGISHQYAAMVNCLFFLVLYLSLYVLGRKFLLSDSAIFSMLTISSFPIVVWMSREVLIDLALIAMTTLFAAVIYEKNIFHDSTSAKWSGITFSLGFLTKQSFLFFAAPMLIYNFLHLRPDFRDFTVRQNAKVFLKWASVSVAWYFLHIPSMLREARGNMRDAIAEGDPMPFTVDGLTYYMRMLYLNQISGWALVVILIGLALAIYRFSPAKQFLAVWFLGGYLILTFVVINKDGRYDMPMIPALVLFANIGLNRLPRFIHFLTNALVCLLLIGTVGYLFGWRLPSQLYPTMPRERHISEMLSCESFGPGSLRAKGEDWNVKKFVELLIERRGAKAKIVVGVLPQSEFFNPVTFTYFAKAMETSFRIQGFSLVSTAVGALDGCDYLVTKTGDQGPKHVTAHNSEIMNLIPSQFKNYKPILSVELPDRGYASLIDLK